MIYLKLQEIAKIFSQEELLITALPVDLYPEAAAVHNVHVRRTPLLTCLGHS